LRNHVTRIEGKKRPGKDPTSNWKISLAGQTRKKKAEMEFRAQRLIGAKGGV